MPRKQEGRGPRVRLVGTDVIDQDDGWREGDPLEPPWVDTPNPEDWKDDGAQIAQDRGEGGLGGKVPVTPPERRYEIEVDDRPAPGVRTHARFVVVGGRLDMRTTPSAHWLGKRTPPAWPRGYAKFTQRDAGSGPALYRHVLDLLTAEYQLSKAPTEALDPNERDITKKQKKARKKAGIKAQKLVRAVAVPWIIPKMVIAMDEIERNREHERRRKRKEKRTGRPVPKDWTEEPARLPARRGPTKQSAEEFIHFLARYCELAADPRTFRWKPLAAEFHLEVPTAQAWRRKGISQELITGAPEPGVSGGKLTPTGRQEHERALARERRSA